MGDKVETELDTGFSFSLHPSAWMPDELRENALFLGGELYNGISDFNQKQHLTIIQWIGLAAFKILVIVLVILAIRRCCRNRSLRRDLQFSSRSEVQLVKIFFFFQK